MVWYPFVQYIFLNIEINICFHICRFSFCLYLWSPNLSRNTIATLYPQLPSGLIAFLKSLESKKIITSNANHTPLPTNIWRGECSQGIAKLPSNPFPQVIEPLSSPTEVECICTCRSQGPFSGNTEVMEAKMVFKLKRSMRYPTPAPLSGPEAERRLSFHQEPFFVGNPPGLVQSSPLWTWKFKENILHCAVESCHGEERGKWRQTKQVFKK